MRCLNLRVWNCVYLGKSGADSDTDEDGDGEDKTGGESVSQWVKENSSKLNLEIPKTKLGFFMKSDQR